MPAQAAPPHGHSRNEPVKPLTRRSLAHSLANQPRTEVPLESNDKLRDLVATCTPRKGSATTASPSTTHGPAGTRPHYSQPLNRTSHRTNHRHQQGRVGQDSSIPRLRQNSIAKSRLTNPQNEVQWSTPAYSYSHDRITAFDRDDRETSAHLGAANGQLVNDWNRKVSAQLLPDLHLADDSTVGGAEFKVSPLGFRLNKEQCTTDDTVAAALNGVARFDLDSADGERPYTSQVGNNGLLGVPGLGPEWADLTKSPSRSEILDGGDQQHLRTANGTSQTPETSADYDDVASLASSSPPDSHYELQGALLGSYQTTQDNGGRTTRFIPKQTLKNLINTKAVTQELIKELPHIPRRDLKRYARKICSEEEEVKPQLGKKPRIRSFRKIFAILVLCEAISSILLFLEDEVSDQDLPLVEISGVHGLCRRSDKRHIALNCFKQLIWSPIKLMNFQDYQWKMLAPYFSQDEDGVARHYILQADHILPFADIKSDDYGTSEKTGGFGRILMRDIHSDHHNFREPQFCTKGFAIKQQMRYEDREAFKKEIRILRKFSMWRHEHIISLLATYEQFDKLHLIFYRAQGDLFEYWQKENPEPRFDHSMVAWVAKQAVGMISGLARLHKLFSFTKRPVNVGHPQITHNNDKSDNSFHKPKTYDTAVEPKRLVRNDTIDSWFSNDGTEQRPISPEKPTRVRFAPGQPPGRNIPQRSEEEAHQKQYGRHGDINPGNILWFAASTNDGITTHGTLKLADFGQAELNTLDSKTKTKSVANTRTYRPPECDLRPNIIRQSYDIWCSGCVLLEFITWLFGGAGLLAEFANLRSSPDPYHDGMLTDTFFRILRRSDGSKEAMVKPEVAEFIERLHRHKNCSVYFHDLLYVIQHDMLVVDSKGRESCAFLENKLATIYDKCAKDIEYATTSNSWCQDRLPLLGKGTSSDDTAAEDTMSVLNSTSAAPLHKLAHRRSPTSFKCCTITGLARLRLSRSFVHRSSSLPASFTNYRPITVLPVGARVRNNTANLALIAQVSSSNLGGMSDDEDFGLLGKSSVDHSLSSQIVEKYVESFFNDRTYKYLPDHRIEELIDLDAIEHELGKIRGQPDVDHEKYNDDFRRDLARWILSKSRRVFAITVQCELKPRLLLLSMILFKRHGFNDEALQLQPLKDPQKILVWNPPKAFPPQIWNQSKKNTFYETQWKFLVPVFSPEQYDYDLNQNVIFPFTVIGSIPKDGAFSFVYRIRIHEGHQKHPHIHEIALKDLKVSMADGGQGTDDAWDKEAEALGYINKLNHPNIVQCIGAVRRGNNRYFLFPWADGDSLRDFWQSRTTQTPNASIILDSIYQLRGMVDALDKLHNFKGGQFDHHVGNESEIKISVEQADGQGSSQIHDEEDTSGGINTEKPDISVSEEYEDVTQSQSIRHGDLKPENILRFLDGKSDLGRLCIADMGLAKRHVSRTQDRRKLTSMGFGTRRYEAPQTIIDKSPRSRLYDIWSMGCITFEYIVWLLYGNNGLQKLYSQLEGATQQPGQYYELLPGNEPSGAQVHHVVLRWLDHLDRKDPECSRDVSSALKDLLKIVREQLLVVALPPNRFSGTDGGHTFQPPPLGEMTTRYRGTAADFRDSLDEIIKKKYRPGYIFTGRNRFGVEPPSPAAAATLAPGAAGNATRAPNLPVREAVKTGVLGFSLGLDYGRPPREGWVFEIDNAFAGRSCKEVSATFFPVEPQAELCARCQSLNLWKGGFNIEDPVTQLRQRAVGCSFCKMLLRVYDEAVEPKADIARFKRSQSSLIFADDTFPALSILRPPDTETPMVIQIGLPELPRPGSDAFFSVMKHWLQDCDTNHPHCRVPDPRLPPRVIDVGTADRPMLQLLETRDHQIETTKYVALSHPWGNTTYNPPFCTLRDNIDQFKKAIPEDQLPATFAHAVQCIRKLGIRYLWIDSICIIQGQDGDFNEQSEFMETVYSGAHCVIAASRATSQRDGFLADRPKREYVTFKGEDNSPFYIGKMIDKFSEDVIEGALNQRGWVLQERALARRTIYFTKPQTYFECGEGVRCETMTKMRNDTADFLGDPNFPSKANAKHSDRAKRIAYFQSLYKQYSRLNFTRYSDRPIAIAGLERRLQKAFETQGAFGIFDDGNKPKEERGLFHRSLLWQRSNETKQEEKKPIDFSSTGRRTRVPSWSWMAYKGGIDYFDPPFRSADWEFNDIIPPWTRGQGLSTESAPRSNELAIIATVRDFNVRGRLSGDMELTYDTEQTSASDGQRAQCVVVAKAKEPKSPAEEKMHYVLLVGQTRATTGRGEKVYKRLGAGFMLGRFISFDTPGTQAHLC
ncbi:hypothetical protein CC86DRAFT_353840 [Ophiobolus disseminans]|uniref:Protein kinase domain-containing protein n=1 Tax=Ophiobolus disseminans TaxID=1469910 RepID=A0A6A6ZVJ2_9PLEO|nr:hypothetical protein CC86DRAFT_353840 [Ophiobolus disseminans]